MNTAIYGWQKVKTIKGVPISILLASLLLLQGLSAEYKASIQEDTYQPRDYSMVSIGFVREALNKTVKLKSIRTRLVKADGQWKEAIISPSGKVTIYWSKPDGVYFGEPGNLYLTRGFIKPPPVFYSVKFLLSHKQFVREESLLGYRTFVLRHEREKGDYTEMYQSPKFGIIPIKSVNHLPDGQEHVIEAVKLEFTEVTDKLLNEENLLWIDRYIAQGIEPVERQGHKEMIEELRQIQRELQARKKK